MQEKEETEIDRSTGQDILSSTRQDEPMVDNATVHIEDTPPHNSHEEPELHFNNESIVSTKQHSSSSPSVHHHSVEVDESGSDPEEFYPLDMPWWKEVIFIFVILSGQFLTQSMVGQVLIPLHVIGRHFNVQSEGELSWYMAGYSLTVGTFILVAGRLGDMYGHKLMFMLGMAWTALWSLLAGISKFSSGTFFIICRVFQGIGPAFLLPAALAILGRSYAPSKKKNMVFALFGACAPSGFNFGAVFSGLVSQFSDWAWAYWLMAIVAGAFLILTCWIVPECDHKRSDEPFDSLGAFTGVAGLILFNFSWNQAPLVGWQEPYIYVLMIVGILLLAAFFYVESRVATHPLVPVKTLSKSVIIVLTCVALGWATFGIWIYYTIELIEDLRGHTLMSTAAQTIPVSFSGFVAAMFTGLLFNLGAPKNLVMLIALIAFTVTIILLATVPVDQTYWAQTFVGFIIGPFGMDMSFPAATLLLSDAVPKKHQGIAASLVTTVVNYSISMGLGFAGTVITYVSPGDSPDEFLRGLRSAAYLGIGMSGSGVILAAAAFVHEMIRRRTKRTTAAV